MNNNGQEKHGTNKILEDITKSINEAAKDPANYASFNLDNPTGHEDSKRFAENPNQYFIDKIASIEKKQRTFNRAMIIGTVVLSAIVITLFVASM